MKRDQEQPRAAVLRVTVTPLRPQSRVRIKTTVPAEPRKPEERAS